MKLQAVQSGLSALSLIQYAISSPVLYLPGSSSSNNIIDAYNMTAGINPVGTTNLTQPGSNALQTDTWHIDGTDLTLQLDYDRAVGIPEKLILDTIKGSWDQIHRTKRPNDKIEEKYEFEIKDRNAIFEIEPTVSQVLKWKDALVCLEGLTNYYNIKRVFTEARFGMDETPAAGDRGRFANGALLKKNPSPPPAVLGTSKKF